MRCKGHLWSKPGLRHTWDPIKGHLHGYRRTCERFPCTKIEEDFPKPCDCPRDVNGVLIREVRA